MPKDLGSNEVVNLGDFRIDYDDGVLKIYAIERGTRILIEPGSDNMVKIFSIKGEKSNDVYV